MNLIEARFTIEDMINYLDSLDPDDFNQNIFFSAIKTERPCGCIAAHSYKRKHGVNSVEPHEPLLTDTPIGTAVKTILEEKVGPFDWEHESLDECSGSVTAHLWFVYIFDTVPEGRLAADELNVIYFDETPQGGAMRLRSFLDQVDLPQNLEDIV